MTGLKLEEIIEIFEGHGYSAIEEFDGHIAFEKLILEKSGLRATYRRKVYRDDHACDCQHCEPPPRTLNFIGEWPYFFGTLYPDSCTKDDIAVMITHMEARK
jgi:hypothetical protein